MNEINQCDGCQIGLPTTTVMQYGAGSQIWHTEGTQQIMRCTKERYQEEKHHCEVCDSFECTCSCKCGLPHDQCVCGFTKKDFEETQKEITTEHGIMGLKQWREYGEKYGYILKVEIGKVTFSVGSQIEEKCCGECRTMASGAPDETVTECTDPKCEYCHVSQEGEHENWCQRVNSNFNMGCNCRKEEVSEWKQREREIWNKSYNSQRMDSQTEYADYWFERMRLVRNQTLESAAEALEKVSYQEHDGDGDGGLSETFRILITLEDAQSVIRSMKK